MHERGSDVEILVETIVEVKAKESLALHGVERLVFERHTDALARVDDALVGDGDYAHGVIDRVVTVLVEHDASGCDYDRASRHIHGIKAYLRA